MGDSTPNSFRWQAFFQNSSQPIFLLSRRGRILFVNRAWETCTGLKMADARVRACKRRSRLAELDKDDAVLSACAPPADAKEGRTCHVRRRAPSDAGWWEIQFMPLAGPEDLLGILGVIRVLKAPIEKSFQLPAPLLALRDRQRARYSLDDIDCSLPQLARLQEQARLAARSRFPLVLLGESGAGKEWLARAIHAASEGRNRYFACLDAGRLPAAAIGDILFGAHGRSIGFGAVYLRESANLPREWQSRLVESIKLQENIEFPRLIVGFCGAPQA